MEITKLEPIEGYLHIANVSIKKDMIIGEAIGQMPEVENLYICVNEYVLENLLPYPECKTKEVKYGDVISVFKK